MVYRDYITSQAWIDKKKNYFATHARRCRACGSKNKIHLHHKTYNRLGEERDADLVALCNKCHFLVHKKHRSNGGSLWTVTEDFIRLKKKSYKNKRVIKKPRSKQRKGRSR